VGLPESIGRDPVGDALVKVRSMAFANILAEIFREYNKNGKKWEIGELPKLSDSVIAAWHVWFLIAHGDNISDTVKQKCLSVLEEKDVENVVAGLMEILIQAVNAPRIDFKIEKALRRPVLIYSVRDVVHTCRSLLNVQ